MSRAIQSTPVLNEEESHALLESLKGGASEADMEQRAERAKLVLAALGAPKGAR